MLKKVKKLKFNDSIQLPDSIALEIVKEVINLGDNKYQLGFINGNEPTFKVLDGDTLIHLC